MFAIIFLMIQSNQVQSVIDEIRYASHSCSEEEIRKYKEEGYVLFPGLISKDAAEQLKAEVMDIMEVVGMGHTKLRQTPQYLLGSALDAFVKSELLCNIASELMEGPARLYLPFTAVKSGGGGGQFHFHQDNNYTLWFGPGINLWTALVPMRKENGALRIAPGSHLGGTVESVNAGDGDNHRKVKYDPSDFEVIDMEPGDTVAFTRLTVHGSGPNDTEEHRVAYAVQYYREDVEAMVQGKRVRLTEDPRWKDIYGVEELKPEQKASRDGH